MHFPLSEKVHTEDGHPVVDQMVWSHPPPKTNFALFFWTSGLARMKSRTRATVSG